MSGPDATLVCCSCGGRDAAAGGLIMCDTCGDYVGIWTPAADVATARSRSFASQP